MRIATKAVIIHNSRYLLQHRDNKKGIFSPNLWGCFGGMIDSKNETDEQGIIRELKEELSIDFKVINKIHEGFHEPSGTKNIFFLAEPLHSFSKINLKEGQNYGWFSLDEIKRLKITWDTEYIFRYLEKDFN